MPEGHGQTGPNVDALFLIILTESSCPETEELKEEIAHRHGIHVYMAGGDRRGS